MGKTPRSPTPRKAAKSPTPRPGSAPAASAKPGRSLLGASLNTTRKAAADAMGERVAMLQDEVSKLTLDAEQQRHASSIDGGNRTQAPSPCAAHLGLVCPPPPPHTPHTPTHPSTIRPSSQSPSVRTSRRACV